MMMISRRDFDALASASDGLLVSILLPTHRRGSETEQDRIRLKNLVTEAERRLQEMGADPEPLADSLAEVRALHEDIVFWRHQGDGLALFLSAEGVRMHRLPITVDEFVHVGHRFCVRPLLRAVSDGSRFHVLALSRNEVRILECTRSTVREIDAHDIPREIRDVVGYDVEQKSLQFHTESPRTGPRGVGRPAVHHGQGAGEDDSDEELERFLRAVDQGILRVFEGRLAPLVLAGVEREMVAYRQISKHPQVLEHGVPGNPEHRSAEQLHAAALEVVEPVLDAEAARRREAIAETASSDRVATGITEVLPAAAEGRVDVLVVCPDQPIWGAWDESSASCTVHDQRTPEDEDLLDRAVAQALRTGAEIIPAQAGEVPRGKLVAARLRY